MKRVIIIDAKNKEIREGTVETLEDMQVLVGGLIEVVGPLSNGDDLFADEEGLFKGYEYGFAIGGGVKILGSGFVIGEVDPEGDSRDCKSTVESVRRIVTWLEIEHERP